MIARQLQEKIRDVKGKFPIITVIGPRQSGKTTLLKAEFPELPYVSLEDLDMKQLATEDPRGFLKNFPQGAFIDEAQEVPALFSYLQGIVDSQDIRFVLSGSQNFLLMEKVSQSLAGRTIIFKLLPLSISELSQSGQTFNNFESYIFKGMYPAVYSRQINPADFYGAYLQTYVEKDVRQIKNIENLSVFLRFIKLCAGRIGQELNVSSLATDVGISPNTAKAWISVLEASFVIYLLPPFFNNYDKRIIKSPKLYFYDTGLACRLLEIEDESQINSFYLRGGLFENLIINEFVKHRYNQGKSMNLHFWKTKTGQEIDVLMESAGNLLPFEIKSGQTMNQGFFKNLRYWQKISESTSPLTVIYGGDQTLETTNGRFLSWKDLEINFS